MAQFIVLPSSDVTGGNITTLANATVEPDPIVTSAGATVVAFATAEVSGPFTPAGVIFAPGPTVISGALPTQFLIVPAANIDAGGALTSLADSFVATTQSLTGLVSARPYRAITLTEPSPPIVVSSAPDAFTSSMWAVSNPSLGGILNFTFTSFPYDGGSPITNVNIYQNGSATPIATGLTAPGVHVISGLTNGNSYSYTVKAVNAVGVASVSSDTKTEIPLAAPPVTGTYNVANRTELLAALSVVQGGDTIAVGSGAYGNITIQNIRPSTNVTIFCHAGAHFENITIRSSSDLTIEDSNVWPITSTPSTSVGLINSDRGSSRIIIRRAHVRGKVDGMDYYSWDLAKWRLKPAHGITLSSGYSSVEDCTLYAVDIGIVISGTNSQMVRNKVRGFSQDGMRLIGDGFGYLIRGNDVANAVTITNGVNHPDGFQAWSALPGQAVGTGLLSDITVEDNIFRNWIGPNPPLPGLAINMQGIGFHNGLYANCIFRNNETWSATPWGNHLYRCTVGLLENNRHYDINRASQANGAIGVVGTGITAINNISGSQSYPVGSVTSGNTAPNYSTAPQMSLAD